MNKLGIIVSREYLNKVKKKSFIFLTILTPIFLLAVMLLPAYLMNKNLSLDEERVVYVDDHTGLYFKHLKDTENYHFLETSTPLKDLLADKDPNFYAYLKIRDNLKEHPDAITIYTKKQTNGTLTEIVKTQLTTVVRDDVIKSYDIPNLDKILADTKVRLNITELKWEKGSDEGVKASSNLALIISNIANVIIYMFILSYGGMVFNSVKEEKKSRVVEIMVSSVKPFDLLLGKIIAVTLVGLTQIVIWGLLIAAGFFILQYSIFSTLSLDPSKLQAIASMQESYMANTMLSDVIVPLQSINWVEMFICFILYFLGGYLLYASIYAALGSAFDNDEDSNQLTVPITLLFILAFYVGLLSAQNPDSTIAIVSSFIPFTSPIVMMVRLPYEPPLWHIIGSILLLWLSAFGLLWVSSRIYRIGILMYGKKPSFKNMLQWIRYR